MIKVGITGQVGFIGTHLFNYLSAQNEEIIIVPFDDSFFVEKNKLRYWVNNCDSIVHLAAMNRHQDQNVIYNVNVGLVRTLINAMDEVGKTPHIIFSSSSQESRDNSYGKSKREGRQMFIDWSEKMGSKFSGLVIPNVFGPNGKPFYNSVIATFCYQLTHSETPKIDVDSNLKLIYVMELADVIFHKILDRKTEYEFTVPFSYEKNVSEILSILERFKEYYFERSIIPVLNDRFELNLFKTFLSFVNFTTDRF